MSILSNIHPETFRFVTFFGLKPKLKLKSNKCTPKSLIDKSVVTCNLGDTRKLWPRASNAMRCEIETFETISMFLSKLLLDPDRANTRNK